MVKRLITGTVYVAVLVGFFFLRLVDHRLFGILIYAFSLFGTYEMLHAFSHAKGEGTEGNVSAPALSQKIAVWVYAGLFTPLF